MDTRIDKENGGENEPADKLGEPQHPTVTGRMSGLPPRGERWRGRVMAMVHGPTSPWDNAVNMHVKRGCPVPRPEFPAAGTKLHEDGSFVLQVPPTTLTFRVDALGCPAVCVGPVQVGPEGLTSEIVFDSAATGRIEGRVDPVDPDAAGNVWVVAFLDSGFNCATRCDRNGHFLFEALPPGRYGLHAGHEALHARWQYLKDTFHVDDHDHPAEPWNGAVVAEVVAGNTVSGLRLELH